MTFFYKGYSLQKWSVLIARGASSRIWLAPRLFDAVIVIMGHGKIHFTVEIPIFQSRKCIALKRGVILSRAAFILFSDQEFSHSREVEHEINHFFVDEIGHTKIRLRHPWFTLLDVLSQSRGRIRISAPFTSKDSPASITLKTCHQATCISHVSSVQWINGVYPSTVSHSCNS